MSDYNTLKTEKSNSDKDRLDNAVHERAQAWIRMNFFKRGTKKRRLAEEDLNFWQGKVAYYKSQKESL